MTTKPQAQQRPSHREAIFHDSTQHGVDRSVYVLSEVFDDATGGNTIHGHIYVPQKSGNVKLDRQRSYRLNRQILNWIYRGNLPVQSVEEAVPVARPSHYEAIPVPRFKYNKRSSYLLAEVFDDAAGGREEYGYLYIPKVSGSDKLDAIRSDVLDRLIAGWKQSGLLPAASIEEIVPDETTINELFLKP